MPTIATLVVPSRSLHARLAPSQLWAFLLPEGLLLVLRVAARAVLP